jgi:hypothetical protein
MLPSQLAIIYLATAAPFGVTHFLDRRAPHKRRASALAKAAAAAFAWPLTAFLFLRKRAALRTGRPVGDDRCLSHGERSVEQVKRETVNSLLAVEDILLGACGFKSEAERHALFVARASVERYAGLALACADADADADASARELELYRVAGSEDGDLLVAGRCVHRRNVTRLRVHRERARAELVHALAGVREVAHTVYATSQPVYSPARADEHAAKQISEALLQALARAVELLSLFDDRAAVLSVARLLDSECARLRRLEVDGAPDDAHEGAGKCTTPVVHTAFATQRLPTPTTPGG